MVFDARQCLPTLTVEALLIILPKRALIESRQCNGKRKKKNQREVKMQPRKAKIMKINASWGPSKVWGPQGSLPCFLPPLGGPA